MKQLKKNEQQIFAANHCGSINCDVGAAIYSLGKDIKQFCNKWKHRHFFSNFFCSLISAQRCPSDKKNLHL